MDELSKILNKANIGCCVGSFIINHLMYADDLVLIAPSAKALQNLIKICGKYAKCNDIIYNTDKTKCMIFWPKVAIGNCAKFILQGKILSVVEVFKYLGVYITSNLTDDYEMGKRTREVYAAGNTVISKFRNCARQRKILFCKIYCYNVYGISLWTSYRVSAYAKLKVAHNDIFRALLNVRRSESASTLFVENNTNNLDCIRRIAMNSLMNRLLNSRNSIVEILCNSAVRVHSKAWKCWAVALGVEWEQIMVF